MIPTNSTCCDDPAIWCAIPVYNNSSTIVDIARRSREQIARVIVVDDGSTDADLRQLLAASDVTVIRHPDNQGKGSALLTAMRYAAERGAKYLITLDGDGQHFPEDIPRFIPQLKPGTILIGYRSEITGIMPRASEFGREFSDFWIHIQTGCVVRDTQSGFRAYPLPEVLNFKLKSLHYNFEMEIITRAIWAGFSAQSIDIRVLYPDADQRVSSFRPVRDNFRISLLHTRLILQQLLPIHRPGFGTYRAFMNGNTTPLGVALCVGLSLLMGIVLWPWGFIAVAYVTIRLHLNKWLAIACLLIIVPTFWPALCWKVGHAIANASAHPHIEWIIGSHVLGFILAPLGAWAAYGIFARKKTSS